MQDAKHVAPLPGSTHANHGGNSSRLDQPQTDLFVPKICSEDMSKLVSERDKC